jgi:hypothetical protein
MTDLRARPSRRFVLVGLACAGGLAGVAGLAILRARSARRAVAEALARARPHLDAADAAGEAAIDPGLASLEGFFDEARSHCPAFADDVLGWWSKLALLRGDHEAYLAEAFRRHFFGPEELTRAMTAAVESAIAEFDAIDNRMLVAIRLDVADLPAAATIASLPEAELLDRYRAECGAATDIATADATVDAGRLAADLIVSSVVGLIAARLTTSAAVVGSGTASGWWTFGIGLVVGVIVDQIIATIWDWTYDPRGRLVALLETKLDEVRSLVIEGEEGRAGLRDALSRYARERAIVRRHAVERLLGRGGAWAGLADAALRGRHDWP